MRVVAPPPPLADTFTRQVAPLFGQITANRRQSCTLSALRDTLLPKLLSGEMRIP